MNNLNFISKSKYRVTLKNFGTENRKPEVYKGLGQLYVNDNRYTKVDGKPNPEFAEFMSEAMSYFVEAQL